MPTRIIENDYSNGVIETVVVAEVTAIGTAGTGKPDAEPWEAEARVIKTLFGPEVTGKVEFVINPIVTNCGWPPVVEARIGEKIAVYFQRHSIENLAILHVMDLGYAEGIDTRIRGLQTGLVSTPDLKQLTED